MSGKKPTRVAGNPFQKRCPVCGQRSYSREGIHPQCAMLQADTPRTLRLAAERKAQEAEARETRAREAAVLQQEAERLRLG